MKFLSPICSAGLKRYWFAAVLLLYLFQLAAVAQTKNKPGKEFKIIAFYTAKADLAHISFVHEANAWFPKAAARYGFTYDSTNNWSNLNEKFLARYQVVLFLDTRPELPEARAAFESYMKSGGAWMGFHFAAFALNNSGVKQNWDWYHQEFLGSGEYAGNTWRPTPAVLKVESRNHPALKQLPGTFKASANEWYRWQNDLRLNKNIDILLAIDSTSFPLGTGPKAHEIWHSGYFPVAWSNKNYRMVYVNMGHNDMDYEHKYDQTNRTLSHTFDNETQNRFIINSLFWLGNVGR